MTKLEGETDYRFVSRECLRIDAEYRDQVCAWIRANGINPADVPADATPVVWKGQLTIYVWERATDGCMILNPTEDGFLRRPVTVPVKVKPTGNVIHWLGSFEVGP